MARVFVRNGTEGPRHDPYSYTEITFVKTDGTEIVYHDGLAQWITVNGVKQPCDYDEHVGLFEELTGIAPWRAEVIPDRLEQRRVNRLTAAEQRSYWACKEADQQMLGYAY